MQISFSPLYSTLMTIGVLTTVAARPNVVFGQALRGMATGNT